MLSNSTINLVSSNSINVNPIKIKESNQIKKIGIDSMLFEVISSNYRPRPPKIVVVVIIIIIVI